MKQQKFVDAYVGEANGNAAEAIIIAGYHTKDRETAGKIGHENLKKVEISKAIAEKRNEYAIKLDSKVDHLLDCLLEMAFSEDIPTGIRVRVITDLLDRAGYTAKKLVSADITVVNETRQTQEIAKRAREMMAERLNGMN